VVRQTKTGCGVRLQIILAETVLYGRLLYCAIYASMVSWEALLYILGCLLMSAGATISQVLMLSFSQLGYHIQLATLTTLGIMQSHVAFGMHILVSVANLRLDVWYRC
jgi:hypothetical protein